MRWVVLTFVAACSGVAGMRIFRGVLPESLTRFSKADHRQNHTARISTNKNAFFARMHK